MEIKKVRTLLRVSSKQQLRDNDIPVQRGELSEYIKKKDDWILDGEYIEKGVSAFKNKASDRKVLMQIIEDAKNKEFDILLAYMSDRIGRRDEYMFFVSALSDLGIEIWTVRDGNITINGHMDKLMSFIRFWQNEGESVKTGDRVKGAKTELVKAGKFVGGKAPYGYKLIDSNMVSEHKRLLKKIIIDEEQAKIVRKIYDLYIHKGYGYQKIANELNSEGIPPIKADKWKNGTVSTILQNPIYMGYFSINHRERGKTLKRLDRKEWVLSKVQNKDIIIISQLDWEKAQEIREARKNYLAERSNATKDIYEKRCNVPFNPRGKLSLLGIAYCGYCGKRLKSTGYGNHWITKDGVEKVSCIGRYGCQERCQERSYYSQDFLESVVFEVVENYLEKLKDVNIAEEFSKMKNQQQMEIAKKELEVSKEIDTIEKDIQTYEDVLPSAIRGEYIFSADTLSRLLLEKQEKLEGYQQELEKIKEEKDQTDIVFEDLAKFIDIAPNWKQVFKETDVPAKRMLLSSLIERIDVTNENISIKFKIKIEDFLGDSDKKLLETIGSPTTLCTHDSR
ncbi:MAG: recombinase family protein [Lachnospiraceae bacterium]|nr:recombinase family protein [Lachnospiraceae bacterium]